jgi:FtsH-binding integral membrane protein
VSSEIYRDPTEGASAKRRELLQRRRDELATMPHAIRRVVVARTARMAAALALVLGGAALVAVTLSPMLLHTLDGMLPGVQPAGAATVLCAAWLLALASYAMSRARSEHRFAVAMSKYVLPGGDLDHDLQRLDHEHPDEMARGMAHHREIGSAAWPVLGAALALPPLGLYIAQAIVHRGWPVMAGFEESLAAHRHAFAWYGVAGVVGALAMTRQATRAPKAAAALLGLAFAIGVAATFRHSLAVAAVTIVPLTMALIVRRLRAERAAIAAIDPAAGSEILSLRDVLRATWTSLRALGRFAGRPATLRAVVGLVVIGVGWAYAHRVKHSAAPAAPPPVQVAAAAPTTVPHMYPSQLGASSFAIQQKMNGDGVIKIDADLDGKPLELGHLAGLYNIPPSWRASVVIKLVGEPVIVTPFLGSAPETLENTQTFTSSSCGNVQQLGLRLEPMLSRPYHVTLYVTPTMAPVDCNRVE